MGMCNERANNWNYEKSKAQALSINKLLKNQDLKTAYILCGGKDQSLCRKKLYDCNVVSRKGRNVSQDYYHRDQVDRRRGSF
jgi:hypothetical protein